MPIKTRHETLILGTWNIRNFDNNRFGSGPRLDDDFYYIAEIIARFDIIAIQEINDDLKPLDRLMDHLGGFYKYIITDVTEGASGNGERMAYIYDRNKVTFKGIAGELVLPDNMKITAGDKKMQFSRTPFACAFQSEWFKFMLSNVHIYFGSSSGAQYKRRVEEIGKVASFLAKRAKTSNFNHILVGDFNIKKRGSDGYNALTSRGFKTVVNKKGSNADQTKFYDQISYWERPQELVLADDEKSNGVFQFFDVLYRLEDFKAYKADIVNTINRKIENLNTKIADAKERIKKTSSSSVKATKEKSIKAAQKKIADWQKIKSQDEKLMEYYLSDWRTFHLSDHLPLWVEFKIDFSESYLDKLYNYRPNS